MLFIAGNLFLKISIEHDFAVLSSLGHIFSTEAIHYLIFCELDELVPIGVALRDVFSGLLNIKLPEAVVKTKLDIVLPEAVEKSFLG